jgi:uncharacterized integral membrane protein (TIGR00698 family)
MSINSLPLTQSRVGAFAGGVALCAALAVAATALSAPVHAPPLVVVLVLGALVRLAQPNLVEALSPGIKFSAAALLRVGVALLGLKVVLDDVLSLGVGAVAAVLGVLLVTVAGGYAVARRLGLKSDLAAIAATSVAVCGASAAMAVSAVTPKRSGLERDTAVVIVVVSLLSTVAMLGYPLIAKTLGYDMTATSILLGGAIHDVAQVVGAGFAVSPDVGVSAVALKLVRVACLMPVVLVWGLMFARQTPDGQRCGAAPAPPLFLLGFLALAALGALGAIPAEVSRAGGELATALLATAVAAIGLRGALGEIREAPRSLFVVLIIVTVVQLAAATALIAVLRL